MNCGPGERKAGEIMASIFKRKGKKSSKHKWLIAYTDADGARRVVTGVTSKTITDEIATSLENEVALQRHGCIDKRLGQYSEAEAVPLIVKDADGEIVGGHVGDFHAAMLARNVTPKHAGMVRRKLVVIVGLTKAERISDLSPSKVQMALQALRDKGLSLQTLNHYLKATKQFSRWLWRDKRASEDTLAHLQGYNVRLDRRHDRRALSDEELVALIHAAETGSVVLGMTGPDRAKLYTLAVETGLRASELRSLTPESFDLDGDPPVVVVEAGYSKRRRRDQQPIRPEVAEMFRRWLADRSSGAKVFDMPDKPAKMMRADLAAAEIPYRDSAGLVSDFHSLRHTFVSNVVRSGASVKVCQELARHSDPKLTLGVYTHLAVHDKSKGLAGLPSLGTTESDTQGARATGTYDA